MLVAVLSDIHSNPYALAAVLADAERAEAEDVWLLGDTFGYHPWAMATFTLIQPVVRVAVIGNHDQWVLDPSSAHNPALRSICRQNAAELSAGMPVALDWLMTLPEMLRIRRCGWTVTLAHGTPASPIDGRYYPDDEHRYPWLPREGEILLLGQTHRPINRGCADSGLILNPGSVGQPRDGNPMPSWALLDLGSGTAEIRRPQYDNAAAMRRLRRRSWEHEIVEALDRR